MMEGLPPNATWRLHVGCDEQSARRIVDVLVEFFEPAETAAAAFEQGPSLTWAGAANWLAEAFFRVQPDFEQVRNLVEQVVGRDLAERLEFEPLREQDWVDASLRGLEAVREGRIVIHGSHGRDRVKPGDIGIQIEAALAFGTGHHGTTRGCLAELNELARRRRPASILDIGTGTGVLAIASARRFNLPVAAGDIDPIAVAAARENARINRVARYVRPVCAYGLRKPELVGRAPFDLIFANILARPLRALAPMIREVSAPGAEIILSGLLAGDVPGVLSSFASQGLRLVRKRTIDGWYTLLIRRPIN